MLANLLIVKENKKSIFVIDSLEKFRKDRYKILYT